jgi:hypothetical protein
MAIIPCPPEIHVYTVGIMNFYSLTRKSSAMLIQTIESWFLNMVSDQNFCCHCDIEMIHLVQMMNLVFFLIFNQHYHFLCLDCLGLITVYKFAFLSICHNTLFQMSCYEFVLIILRMLLKSTKHTCDTSLKATTEVIIWGCGLLWNL